MSNAKPDPLTPFEGRFKVDKNGHLLVDGQKISVKVDWWITASAVSGAVISLLGLIVSLGASLDKLKINFGIEEKPKIKTEIEINERICRQVIREVIKGGRVNRTIEDLPCEDRVTKVQAPQEE
jgi:hypothetical protein